MLIFSGYESVGIFVYFTYNVNISSDSIDNYESVDFKKRINKMLPLVVTILCKL